MGRGAWGDVRYRGQGHSQCACVIIMFSDFLCAWKVVNSATFLFTLPPKPNSSRITIQMKAKRQLSSTGITSSVIGAEETAWAGASPPSVGEAGINLRTPPRLMLPKRRDAVALCPSCHSRIPLRTHHRKRKFFEWLTMLTGWLHWHFVTYCSVDCESSWHYSLIPTSLGMRMRLVSVS